MWRINSCFVNIIGIETTGATQGAYCICNFDFNDRFQIKGATMNWKIFKVVRGICPISCKELPISLATVTKLFIQLIWFKSYMIRNSRAVSLVVNDSPAVTCYIVWFYDRFFLLGSWFHTFYDNHKKLFCRQDF